MSNSPVASHFVLFNPYKTYFHFASVIPTEKFNCTNLFYQLFCFQTKATARKKETHTGVQGSLNELNKIKFPFVLKNKLLCM